MTQSLQLSRSTVVALIATSGGCMVVMMALVLLGGATTPGYSHAAQFISELGATGAAGELWVRFGGFLPAGVFLLFFCVVALIRLPRSRSFTLGIIGLAVFAAGYLVASAFPCDPGCRPQNPSVSQLIHNVGGLAGYVLAPAFLLAMASAVRHWPDASALVAFGRLAAAAALFGLLTLSPSSPFAGLSQRLLEMSVLGWAVGLGCYAFTQRAR